MSVEQKWSQTVAKTWDENAKTWDERSISMWDHGSRKDIIPFLEKYLEKDSKVIDVGCGSGYGTYKLHEAGFKATGIDVSPKMIDLAKEQFSEDAIRYFTCDMSELAERAENYDAALVINVFEWTENPQAALQHLHTILNDKGYVCITIFGPTAGPRQHSYPRLIGEDVIFNTIMPWEFERLTTRCGFSIVDEYGVYKKELTNEIIEKLSKELQQAVSFMWVYILQKQ